VQQLLPEVHCIRLAILDEELHPQMVAISQRRINHFVGIKRGLKSDGFHDRYQR
jgi:hypothetical protein